MTPARPMLPAVLGHLTDLPPDIWAAYPADRLVLTGTSVAVRLAVATTLPVYAAGPVPWITRDPAEAYELLQARDLVPLDCRSRFVCEACGGRGIADRPGVDFAAPCYACRVAGHRPHPPTVAALIAWASLGFDGPDGILGREQHADAMYPQRGVVWQVAAQSTFAMQADGAEFRFPSGALVAITIPPITTTA